MTPKQNKKHKRKCWKKGTIQANQNTPPTAVRQTKIKKVKAIYIFVKVKQTFKTNIKKHKGTQGKTVTKKNEKTSWGTLPEHMIPMSSSCWQELNPHPRWEQEANPDSFPVHCTLSIQIRPLPGPKLWYMLTKLVKPSSWQTTRAFSFVHLSSHTVPHSPRWKISTRPSLRELPPLKRTSPSVPPSSAKSRDKRA